MSRDAKAIALAVLSLVLLAASAVFMTLGGYHRIITGDDHAAAGYFINCLASKALSEWVREKANKYREGIA